MIGAHTRRLVRTRPDSSTGGELTVLEHPGDLGGGVQPAVDPDLADTAGGARAGPQVVISRAVDLGLEACGVKRHVGAAIDRSISGLSQWVGVGSSFDRLLAPT